MLEQLLGGVVTPSVIIDLLPGHEGYTVSLNNRGGWCVVSDILQLVTITWYSVYVLGCFGEQYFYIVRENLVGEVVNLVNHHQ